METIEGKSGMSAQPPAAHPVEWNHVRNHMQLPWTVGLDEPPEGWVWDKVRGVWVAPVGHKSPFYLIPDPRIAECRAGLIELRTTLRNLSFKDAAITAALEQIHKMLGEQ